MSTAKLVEYELIVVRARYLKPETVPPPPAVEVEGDEVDEPTLPVLRLVESKGHG